jgi:cobalt ECF transporter T component CbiQ
MKPATSRSFLERNLSRLTEVLQESVFAEEAALLPGWLQRLDPRVKLSGFLLILLASAFSHSMMIIVGLLLFSIVLAAGSRLFGLSFLRRVWIFMPFYTALVALPALFITPGEPAFRLGALTVTQQGVRAAAFLTLRVAVSVSFMLLMVLTTSWPVLLKALRSLGFPRLFIFLLSVTYRYIYVLLSSANALFLARKSRKLGPEAWQSTSRWTGALFGSLLEKSYVLGNEVFLAMKARGFRGEAAVLTDFRLRSGDVAWMLLLFSVAGFSFYFGFWRLR